MPCDRTRRNYTGVDDDGIALLQMFAQPRSEYNLAISGGKVTVNKTKPMLFDTLAIQEVILEIKLKLADKAG